MFFCHSSSSDQYDSASDDEECTKCVEDLSSDTTSGWELGSLLVDNISSLNEVGISIVACCNCKCRVCGFVISSWNCFFYQSIGSIYKTRK